MREYTERLIGFAQKIEQLGARAALISGEANVRWLSGFTGDSAHIFWQDREVCFLTDGRYTEQARREIPGEYEIVCTRDAGAVAARRLRGDVLGVEKDIVSAARMEQYAADMRCTFVDIGGILAELRAIKSPGEVERMRRAAKLTEQAFQHTLGYVRVGVTEQELYAELLYFFHKHGAEPSFTPIIAGGENSAMPHARVSGRALRPGDLLTFDIGCVLDGMCSDFTRTVAISGVDAELEMIYNSTARAQLEALGAVRAGAHCADVDRAARRVIEDAGYGAFFSHGTGHGVGLEIHEAPRLGQDAEGVLAAGMAVTLEPGIYLPGRGGVRIEDMVLVTESGCENFYTASKALIIL